MKKEDMRILWNCNEKGLITDIQIAEFKKGKLSEWPLYLNRIYTYDFGNSSSNWSEISLYDILIKFGYFLQFKDADDRTVFLKGLLVVDEFNEIIEPWL